MRAVGVLALAGLRHKPARTALSILVVALGVALMVALQAVVVSVDRELVAINAGPEAGADWIVGRESSDVPTGLVTEVAALPEVEWVAPRTQGGALVLLDGDLTEAMLYAIDGDVEVSAGLLRVIEGRMPRPGEQAVAFRADVARRLGISLGEPVQFQMPDGRQFAWPMVGLTGREGVGGSGGFFSLVVHKSQVGVLGLPTGAQSLLVGLKENTKVQLDAKYRDLLGRYAAAARPPTPPYQGSTGAMVLLLVFSLLGPLLGSFLIQNSFAITLRQRLQELALWRIIGAVNRQLVAALLLEGAVIGGAGGAVGLVLGLGLARGLLNFIVGFASTSPTQSLAEAHVWLPPWMALLSLGVGAGVTVLAMLRPAMGSARSAAIAAHREAYQPDPPVRLLPIVLWSSLALVTMLATFAFDGKAPALLLATSHFGALLMLLAPIVRFLASRFPYLPGTYGFALTLGIRRVGESSRRAAGGARALMVATGLLVGFSAVTNATWQATEAAVRADRSDLQVRGSLTTDAAQHVAATDGVAGVTLLYRLKARLGNEILTAWALEPDKGLPFALKEGDADRAAVALREGGAALVGSNLARQFGLQTGDPLEVAIPRQKGAPPPQIESIRVTVVGIVAEDWDGPGTFYLSLKDANEHFHPVAAVGMVILTPGARSEEIAAALRRQTPGARIITAAQRFATARQGHEEKLGTFVAILYVLALFGTLGVIQASVLSVLEQKREVGLLRAAGATPRQAMLLSLIQGAFPGAIGVLVGAFGGGLFGFHFVRYFATWRGSDLSAGFTHWYVAPAIILILSLLAAVPATVVAARRPAAEALRSI